MQIGYYKIYIKIKLICQKKNLKIINIYFFSKLLFINYSFLYNFLYNFFPKYKVFVYLNNILKLKFSHKKLLKLINV